MSHLIEEFIPIVTVSDLADQQAIADAVSFGRPTSLRVWRATWAAAWRFSELYAESLKSHGENPPLSE